MNKIPKKFIAGGFSLALILFLGASGATYLSIRDLSEEKLQVAHTQKILNALNEAFDQMRFAEGGRRGYIITKEKQYLTTYESGIDKTQQAIATARKLTRNNPEKLQKIEKLEKLIAARLAITKQSINIFLQNPSSLTTQIALTNRGMELQQAVQEQLNSIIAEEERQLQVHTNATDANIYTFNYLVGVGYCVSLLLLINIYFLLQRQISLSKALSEQAESALEDSQAKLNDIINNTTTSIVSFRVFDDGDWEYEYQSVGCEAVYGFSSEEIVTNKFLWISRVLPEDLDNAIAPIFANIRTEKSTTVEFRFQHKNGSCRWVEATYTSRCDRIAGCWVFTAVSTDISDRKQIEADRQQAAEQLRQALEDLEIKVQQRTEALQKLNQELQHSNQELEKFAYIVSHDLQEPLRAINGYTNLLVQQYPEREKLALLYANNIIDSAKTMGQLIQDLLAYSRVGSRKLNLTPIDCNILLKEVLGNLHVAIAQSHAAIAYDSLPTVTADKTQLVQLFQNLIANAIKFHGKSPLKIDIGATSRILNSSANTLEWLFWVRDNGIGIKPRYLECIFEVFRRLHTREEFPGMGIGLAICKKIIQRHAGSIWVESEPEIGTTFYFTLPQKS